MSLDLTALGDQTGEYTEEEENAIQRLYELIDGDSNLQTWSKYAQKNILIISLRSSNLNPDLTYKFMKDLHKLATETSPEIFKQLDPISIKPIIDQQLFQVVSRPNDVGPAVLVFRIGKWDPSKASPEEVGAAGALYVYAAASISPEIQRKGLYYVCDVSGLKMCHVKQISIKLSLMVVKMYGMIPPIVKGICVINSMMMFEHTFSLFKWILPTDLRKLIHVTKGTKTPLNKLLPPSHVPEEFGGEMPTEEAFMDGIEEKIHENPQLFKLIDYLQRDVRSVLGQQISK